MQNTGFILQDVVYLRLCWIKIENEHSASAKPVKNQGFNLASTIGFASFEIKFLVLSEIKFFNGAPPPPVKTRYQVKTKTNILII